MPTFRYEPKYRNDKSALSEGWHPAYLLAITDEDKNPKWRNFETAPRIWRWHFAVWEVPTLIGRQDPEHQTAASEQVFSPGGNGFSPSKAYAWTRELLGRDIHPMEDIDMDGLARANPIPCRIKVVRSGEYVNVKDLEGATTSGFDGAHLLTPALRATLAAMVQAGLMVERDHRPPISGGTPVPATPVTIPPSPPVPTAAQGGTQIPLIKPGLPRF